MTLGGYRRIPCRLSLLSATGIGRRRTLLVSSGGAGSTSPRSKSAEFGTRRSKIAEIGTPSRTLSGFAAGSFLLLLLPHGLLWVARSRWVVSFAFTPLAACQDVAQDVEIAPKVSQTQQPSLSTDDVAENPDKNACRSTS